MSFNKIEITLNNMGENAEKELLKQFCFSGQ